MKIYTVEGFNEFDNWLVSVHLTKEGADEKAANLTAYAEPSVFYVVEEPELCRYRGSRNVTTT